MKKQQPLTIGVMMQNYGKGLHRIPAEVLEESVIGKSGQRKPIPEVQKKLEEDLLYAAIRGDVQKMNELLEKGADVNAKDKHGWTSLMFASANGHTEVAELLIQREADVNAKNKYGRTAIKIAKDHHHKKIVKLLKKHGAKGALPKLKLFFRKRKKAMVALSLAAALAGGFYGALAGGFYIRNHLDLRKAEKVASALIHKDASIPQIRKNRDHLIRALESENPYVRFYAVRLLEKTGDRDAIPLLAKRLDDKAKEVRQTAFYSISHIAKKNRKTPELQKAVPALIDVFDKDFSRDADLHARRDACFVIRDITENINNSKTMEPAIKPLEYVLNNSDEDICAQKAAIDALVAIGKPAFPALRQAKPKIIPHLLEIMGVDSKRDVVKSTFYLAREIVISNQKNPELLKTVPYLIGRLDHANWKVRVSASIFLGIIARANPGHPELVEAVPVLTGRLKDEHWMMRYNSATVLSDIAKAMRKDLKITVVSQLKGLLHDKNSEVRTAARNALKKIRESP